MNFKINGLPWKLLDLEQDDKRLIVKGDNPCFGVTCFRDLEIWMDGTQPKELYRQTLIHELIHAFTFSFGVHLVANEDTEESVCDFMGAHMDEIMRLVNRAFKSRGKEGAKCHSE